MEGTTKAKTDVQGVVKEKEKPRESSKEISEDELERLAVESLLQEARRGKVRAEEAGPSGWKKCELPKTNKRFLSNIVMGAMAGNRKKMRLEPEQLQHSKERYHTSSSQSKRHSESEKKAREHASKHHSGPPKSGSSCSKP